MTGDSFDRQQERHGENRRCDEVRHKQRTDYGHGGVEHDVLLEMHCPYREQRQCTDKPRR